MRGCYFDSRSFCDYGEYRNGFQIVELNRSYLFFCWIDLEQTGGV